MSRQNKILEMHPLFFIQIVGGALGPLLDFDGVTSSTSPVYRYPIFAEFDPFNWVLGGKILTKSAWCSRGINVQVFSFPMSNIVLGGWDQEIIKLVCPGYCRTGKLHDRLISQNWGSGHFTTGKFREFLGRGPSQLLTFGKNSTKNPKYSQARIS